MGAPKPQKMPSESTSDSSGSTTNTYGFMSQDANNPFVKAYMDAPINVDPGAAQRTDLAEQSAQHRWGGGFGGGVPELLRMRNQGAEQQQIAAQGAHDQQSANYAQSMADLQRKQNLLPQLVQTGGTQQGQSKTTGYTSQFGPQNGFLSSLAGGAGAALGGFL